MSCISVFQSQKNLTLLPFPMKHYTYLILYRSKNNHLHHILVGSRQTNQRSLCHWSRNPSHRCQWAHGHVFWYCNMGGQNMEVCLQKNYQLMRYIFYWTQIKIRSHTASSYYINTFYCSDDFTLVPDGK